MNTIWIAALAWIGWNIGGPLLIGAIVLALVGLWSVPGAIRRARCPHLRFYETSSCDAVCSDCGKNLGFIENARRIRDQRTAP